MQKAFITPFTHNSTKITHMKNKIKKSEGDSVWRCRTHKKAAPKYIN